MNIMKKRISLILGIMMLAMAILPLVNVIATDECQVSMTVIMDGKTTMERKGNYDVKGGEKIVVNSNSSVTTMAFVGYYFSDYDSNGKVIDNMANTVDTLGSKSTIIVPERKAGTKLRLSIEAVASNDDGSANTVTKTGWFNYYLNYVGTEEKAERGIKATADGVKLVDGSTTTITKTSKIVISAIPENEIDYIYYKWDDGSEGVKVESSTANVKLPNMVAGKIYTLVYSVQYTDGSYTKAQVLKFKLADEKPDTPVEPKDDLEFDLDIEPWMEENDETEELSISLRNDSENEEKANKNIYELDEVVTYYIDYKNGGDDINKEVSIRLNLPLDFKVVSLDGGKLDDDEIVWVFEDGLEEGEAGTIVCKVKYTDLKKSKDDANTIYPEASIYSGSKVRDVSAVINFIIREYDEEIDIEHEPYMYGDADSDTFRPDYIITRAEGALVLARIYGLDYENEKTITTKYTDINDTYLEAQKAITAASKAGLINGYEEANGTYTYRPNSKMTKAEFMKILACMIQEGAEDEDIDGLEIKHLDSLVKVYNDTERYYVVEGKRVYTHWAIEEITLLARLNMLPLTEDEPDFDLDEKITRAEIAQLVNFYLLRAPAEVTSKTKTGFSDVSKKHRLVGDIIEATREAHTFSITDEALEVEE